MDPSPPGGPGRARSLPVGVNSFFSSIPDIRSALAQLEMGYFRTAAQLGDAILQDDRISGVLGTREGALVASDVDVAPANDKRKALKIAEMVGGSEDTPGRWSEMFPDSVVRDLSHWGNLIGFGVAEIVWSFDDETKMHWPRLVPWHPQFVRWDWTYFGYKLQTMDQGEISLPRVDEQPYSDGHWVVWLPHGYSYGWLKSSLRFLARKYIERMWGERDWARYNEIHGSPITAAYVPANATPEQKEQFFSDVHNRGAEATVRVPRIDGQGEHDGWGIDLIEATARTYQTFDLFAERLNTDIAVSILGQNLTTEVKGGSRAAAEMHNLVRIDKLREDARLAECLRAQVLTHWVRKNFGDVDLTPRPSFDVEPPEDETQEGAAFKALGDGIASLKLASDRVDEVAILDRAGVPLLSDEELAAQREEKMARAAEMAAQQQPVGAGEGDDGKGAPSKPTGGGGGFPPKKAALSLGGGALPTRTFAGLPVAIENRAGTVRLWMDGPAQIGATTMQFDYGYIEGVMGSDKEELDVYLGPDEGAADVHVIHQLATPDYKRHDEDKTMLGFPDAAAAKAAYLAHRNDGEQAFGGMSTIPVDRFKAKLERRTGTGKIRASAIVDAGLAERAIFGLMSRAAGATQLRARTRKGNARAKLYADAVADRAKAEAARVLAPDLVALTSVIDASSDFEDLRRRLPGALKKMDPARAAALVEKARLMAHLGGRLAAVKTL